MTDPRPGAVPITVTLFDCRELSRIVEKCLPGKAHARKLNLQQRRLEYTLIRLVTNQQHVSYFLLTCRSLRQYDLWRTKHFTAV